MSRISFFLTCLAMLTFTVGLGGCAQTTDSPTETEQTSADDHDGDHDDGHDHDADHDDDGDHAGHDHDGEDHDADHDEHAEHDHGEHAGHAPGEFEEAFAQLSEADRAAAEAQKICPVTDDPLGAMGMPIKVTINDRDVFLCCEGCKTKITEQPDKYLAKLK